MTEENFAPELSRQLPVEDLDKEDNTVIVEADIKECAALAERLNIVAIANLRADCELFPKKGGREVIISGSITASVTQTCGVTLEPFEAPIAADFEVFFAEDVADQGREPEGVDANDDDQDLPEPIINGIIDLGEVVAQQLSLELDPFPRAPGVEFKPENHPGLGANTPTNPQDDPDNPFAALASLKNKLK